MLYDHQQKLLDLNPAMHLIAWGTGTGKTITAIELAMKNGEEALIICPKSLVEQWKAQVPDNWLVISKEQFKKKYRQLNSFNCLIVDEAHYFGNYKSGLTKALLDYIKLHKPKYRYLLTATPYLSSSWNLYSYGLIFGKDWNWYKWYKHYFNEVKFGQRKIPVAKKIVNGLPIEQEIARLVSVLGSTVALEDCFDVPEQVYQVEYFDLTKRQIKAIEDMWDPLPIVRFTSEAQICGGTLKGDGYREDQTFASEKMDRVLDIIKANKKLIVVCHFNNEIKVLANKVGKKKAIIINGDAKDRHKLVALAEEADDCVVFIQAACSEGFELPSFPLMVFYSYDYSLKNAVQMKGRILRANKLKKNVYLSLIVTNSIDEDIYKCIERKEDFNLAIYEKS
jgi:superfamily II DNA or RNA helicase